MITIISYHELELERAAELQWIELQLHQRLISLIHQNAIMMVMMMVMFIIMFIVIILIFYTMFIMMLTRVGRGFASKCTTRMYSEPGQNSVSQTDTCIVIIIITIVIITIIVDIITIITIIVIIIPVTRAKFIIDISSASLS